MVAMLYDSRMTILLQYCYIFTAPFFTGNFFIFKCNNGGLMRLLGSEEAIITYYNECDWDER
jgi:hypothetical protein